MCLNSKQFNQGGTIRYLIAVLLSALLTLLIAANTTTSASLHIKTKAQPTTSTTVSRAPIAERAKAKVKVSKKAPKAKKAAVTKPKLQPKPIYQSPPTHEAMMAAAGISPSDYQAVDYIISHESSWNVNATEPTSGAHGLPQALPYSKTGCGWSDGVCQLKWASQYAVARYGGWQQAYSFWVANRYW